MSISNKQIAYSEGCATCDDNVMWKSHSIQTQVSSCSYVVYYGVRTCPTNINEIKIDSIRAISSQGCNINLVLQNAQKAVLQSSLSLLNSNPSGGTIRIKKYSCYNDSTYQNCDTNCSSTDYLISRNKNNDSVWYSISQVTNNSNNGACGILGGECTNKSNNYVSENTILSKFPISQSDNPNDFSCLQECFWTLHGNDNVTNTNYMGSFNDKDVIFKRFANEKMRITENGIGIGTKTPIGKLDINFNRWGWLGTEGPSFPKISFGASKAAYSDVDNFDNPYIAFYRQTGFPTVCANNNPNFDSYNWRIELDAKNNNNDPTDWSSYGALNFKSAPAICAGEENPTTKMTLLQNGNVGIGTMLPKEKLHILGKVRINQTGTGLNKAPINQNADYQLAVEGKIVAKEIVVNIYDWGWPDFVFDANYKLKDLNELEKEIKQNKRLPNIPSEKEIKESGVNLGEMQSKMMQKIEELTLYLIQQQKKINELEIKINKNKE